MTSLLDRYRDGDDSVAARGLVALAGREWRTAGAEERVGALLVAAALRRLIELPG